MELPGWRKKRKTSNKIDEGREGLCDRGGCEEIHCSEPWRERLKEEEVVKDETCSS